MTDALLLSLLRHALTIAGGALVTRGYTDDGTAQEVIGALLTLAGLGLSLWNSHKTQKALGA